jgi:PadR family transcriptional regulator, regulatory protein AphA
MPTREAAVARLTTTEAAVLALLAIEGERSGYDLLKLVQRSIAHLWSPARSGLYSVLPRLVELKLASRRRVAQSTRPDKHLYRLAPPGRAALDAWLATVEPGARETFFLKLFVGALTTHDVLLEHLDQFRSDTEDTLERLRAIVPTNTNRGNDWYHRHLLDLGIERAEHELAWARRVARAIEQDAA